MTAELKHRQDWTPWAFELDSVDLRFELDAKVARVTSRLALRRRSGTDRSQPLRLEGRGLALQEVVLDGHALAPNEYGVDTQALTIPAVADAFTLEIRNEVSPERNLSGRGLFVLGDTLVTQMEPEGMSRVTYFPDRPDVLARYRVTLVADRARYPVLLSNGNRAREVVHADGTHEVVWDDPFRKPCYVFGLVAGALGCLRDTCRFASGREVRLAAYAPKAHVERCRFALQALARAMRWDETVYGLECDVDDYAIVALPGFAGAMENKGLNLFDLAGVVADPDITTDDEALTIERIIAHEYFHNWTGNRVTCRDWFQLSLKEGLTRFRDQCYTDDLLGGAYRIDMVRHLQRNQFPEDEGPNRHPIRPERYADVEELYTATVYDKGAEVIRMLHTLLGPEGFRQGVRAWLREYDGEAVTCDDFIDSMARACGRDLAAFARWTSQAGRPRVQVERFERDGKQLLRLTQSIPDIKGRPPALVIPLRLTWVGRDGPIGGVRRTDGADPSLIVLSEPAAEVAFEALPAEAVPSLLEGFSAPVSLEPAPGRQERQWLLAHARDPWARWSAAQGWMAQAIRDQAAAWHRGHPLAFDETLVQTLGALLDEALADRGRRWVAAEWLRVPDEPVLSEGRPLIDVDGHHAARTALRASLGRALREGLLCAVQDDTDDDRALGDVRGMGRRRLAAVGLDLLAAAGGEDIARLCHDRALHAPTMTERFDALSCLVDLDHPLREQALVAFIERWRDHPTVVTKWFNAQALSRSPGAVDRIIALQQHPLFNPVDMALGMALQGGFFRQNRVAFHDLSGRGYEWLADTLLQLDHLQRPGAVWITPQIAQWRRHGPQRQALMRCALQRVAAADGLSNGTRGLIERLLDEPA